jgi:hypothetical protein
MGRKRISMGRKGGEFSQCIEEGLPEPVYFDCGPCLIGPKLFHTKLFRRRESSEGAADGAPLCRPP